MSLQVWARAARMQSSRVTTAPITTWKFICLSQAYLPANQCPLIMATGEGGSTASTSDKLEVVLKAVRDFEVKAGGHQVI